MIFYQMVKVITATILKLASLNNSKRFCDAYEINVLHVSLFSISKHNDDGSIQPKRKISANPQ